MLYLREGKESYVEQTNGQKIKVIGENWISIALRKRETKTFGDTETNCQNGGAKVNTSKTFLNRGY